MGAELGPGLLREERQAVRERKIQSSVNGCLDTHVEELQTETSRVAFTQP